MYRSRSVAGYFQACPFGGQSGMAAAFVAAILLLLVAYRCVRHRWGRCCLLLALLGFAIVLGAALLLVARRRARNLPSHPETLLPTEGASTGSKNAAVTSPTSVPGVDNYRRGRKDWISYWAAVAWPATNARRTASRRASSTTALCFSARSINVSSCC